jgi:hypothetical protein
MPTVVEDLSDGLKLTLRDGGYVLTRVFHCEDLIGANPIEIFASALKMTAGGPAHFGGNVPDYDDLQIVNGVELYAREFDVEPFSAADATVTVNYIQTSPIISGFGPTIIEVGSTLEVADTEFSADQLTLPWDQRTPIEVLWDRSVSGQPGANAEKQTPRVPAFVGKAARRYIREQSTNPETIAESVVGRTNLTTWKGLPQDAAMCVEYVGRYSGDGRWTVNAAFAVDREGLFRSVARAIDSQTGQPAYVNQLDVQFENGIKVVRTALRYDFNSLGF